MRNALVAAVSAVCLAMPAVGASAESAALAARIPEQALRLRAPVPPLSMNEALTQTHHLRFEGKRLEYYPFGPSGLHFEAGAPRDKGGLTELGVRRKVSPGVAIAYDEPIGAHGKVKFDIGLRRSRDVLAAELFRLAVLGPERARLGAPAARFGPVAHLSFIHGF